MPFKLLIVHFWKPLLPIVSYWILPSFENH